MAPVGSSVIDISAAIKWLIDEKGRDTVLTLQSAKLAAPALLRIEAGNVLRTLVPKRAISEAQALDLFAFFQTAPMTIVDHDEELEKRALDLALVERHGKLTP